MPFKIEFYILYQKKVQHDRKQSTTKGVIVVKVHVYKMIQNNIPQN